MTDSILRVEHLMMHFGGIKALNDVNLEVERGSITALIGPNGAGKTTVFNCLTGFYRATGGSIVLRAREKVTDVIQVLGQKLHPDDFLHPAQLGRRIYYKMFGGTHLVNRAGLARTFQNIRLFREMSVIENLLVAQHTRGQPPSAGRDHQYPWVSAGGESGAGSRFLLAGGGGDGGLRQPSGGDPLLRTAAAAGDCPRHVHPSGDDLSGRAGRRPQPGGNPRR